MWAFLGNCEELELLLQLLAVKVIQWTHRCGSIRFVLTQPVYTGHCDIDPVILVEYVNGPADPGLLGLS